MPLIYQPLSPTSIAPGHAGFKLTVSGTGFSSSSVVNWNGVSLSSTMIDSSQITADVPANFIKSAGTAAVTVSNSGPGSGTSNVEFLTVSVNPTSLPVFSDVLVSTPFAGTYALVAADLNRDGHMDIAGVNNDNFVFVLLGNGDGTFQPAVSYPVGDQAVCLVAADFNGDGNLDLAVANEGEGTVSVLLGNGDGTFRAQKKFAAGSFPYVLLTADINQDGKLDLIAGLQDGPPGEISILLGNGDGTFEKGAHYGTGGDTVDAMAMGDFNHDGILDIVTFDHNIDSASVLLGIGNGGFQAPTFVKFPIEADFQAAIAADFNGDGNLDLAVSWEGVKPLGGIFVVFGDGNGGFPSIHNSLAGSGPMGIGAGDFNADGILDLVSGDWNGGDLALLLGEGNGTFHSPHDYAAGRNPEGIALADFNEDGKLDAVLALPNGGDNSIAVLLQK